MKMGRGFFSFRRLRRQSGSGGSSDQRFTGHDLLAIILAVFSLIVPWALAIVAGLALILFLLTKFYLK